MSFVYPLRFSRWYKLLPSMVMDFPATQKVLWLTFDDGPVHPDTGWTLNELEHYKIPATFFVLTDRALGNRTLLNELNAAGHEIALHGWHHYRQFFENSRKVLAEWNDSRQRFEQMLGRPVNRFRPPYAVPPLFCWSKLLQEGLRPVYLTWMLGDFITTLPVDEVLKRLRPQLTPGNILLMHDGGPAPSTFRKLLPELLQQLTDDGWQFIIPSDSQLV